MIINTSSGTSAKGGESAITEARALRYTCDAWFPVNPEALREIRRRIKDNSYLSAKELLDDIRQDFALLGHILKQLATPSGESTQLDFVKRLQQIDLGQLKSLLPVAENKVSSHRFNQLSELQCLRLQHFAITSSTVRAVVEKEGVNETIAICAVFFRQLGLALVCWNYPRIFQRVSAGKANSPAELESALTNVLGFSPTLLGINIAKAWGAPQSLLGVIQSSSALPSTKGRPELPPELSLIAQLCEQGEAFARAYDESHFACADSDRRTCEDALQSSIGQRALNALKAEISHKIERIRNFMLPKEAAPSPEIPASTQAGTIKSLQENSFALQCPDAIQRTLAEVYSLISPGKPSPAALKRLIEHSISACGFDRGCIYLPRANDTKLVPHVVIGGESKESFVPAFMRCRTNLTDPIERALLIGTPIKGSADRAGETRILFVSGALGGGSKTGVLYLESSYSAFQDELLDITLYFRAIQQALADALSLPTNFSSRSQSEK